MGVFAAETVRVSVLAWSLLIVIVLPGAAALTWAQVNAQRRSVPSDRPDKSDKSAFAAWSFAWSPFWRPVVIAGGVLWLSAAGVALVAWIS